MQLMQSVRDFCTIGETPQVTLVPLETKLRQTKGDTAVANT